MHGYEDPKTSSQRNRKLRLGTRGKLSVRKQVQELGAGKDRDALLGSLGELGRSRRVPRAQEG